MKVVLTGGGTGGHFYPLIAVSEQLNNIINEENIADVELYYFADKEYNKDLLYENNLSFKKIRAGKLRIYPSLKNISDAFKTFLGVIDALFALISIFPDVVFSKGGYVAFPTVYAAKLLKIPVIIHESDSVPGRVNQWSGKFARYVAVSYKQEIEYFDRDKIVHSGQPIRADFEQATKEGAHTFLDLAVDVPVIWIIGGSLGAAAINDVVNESLTKLLPKYQIIHQTGEAHYETIKQLTQATLKDHEFRNRYHIFPYLNNLSMKMTAGIADVVITRAGSMLFEIANWRIPAIVIPITKSHKNHQIKNAYNYAREGACTVIEENNLSDSQLVFEINRIYDDVKVQEAMKMGAAEFDIPDAALTIAKEIAGIALSHDM